MTVPQGTLGSHWLVDYRGCDADVLADIDRVETLMVEAIIASGATPLERAFHRFNPAGVSGAVLLEESHITIHTWPEQAFAAVDFYTCGDTRPQSAHALLLEGLGASDSTVTVLRRGVNPVAGSATPQVIDRGPQLRSNGEL